MPQFAANISLMYTELPFLDRFEAAARDGFRAVEFFFPYAFSPATLAGRLKDNGLKQVLFNAPPGGTNAESIAQAVLDTRQRGTACLPGRVAEFQSGVLLALEYAEALDCPRLHLMAGLMEGGVGREALRDVYVDNLRWAARQAAQAGRHIMIEPINPRDVPGFFLNRQAEAHAVLADVAAINLKVQMDLYHCQIVEGDLASNLRRYLPTGNVGHLQIAGVPERHEPDVGEINYPYLFELIDALDFDGWIGCEYRPRTQTTAGLGWVQKYLNR